MASKGRFKKVDIMKKLHSKQVQKTTETGLDIEKVYNNGLVPDALLGLGGAKHGTSMFSGVAHGVEQMNRMNNFFNNGVDDQIVWTVKRGDQVVTTPFQVNGKTFRPDQNGNVRITDTGKINLVAKIRQFQQDTVDKLMKFALLGDDVCAFTFGLTIDEWKGYCKKNGSIYLLGKDNMSEELDQNDCSIMHIKALPPSLTQTQCMAKLRKLVEYYAPSVNMEGLTTVEDAMSNMKDGHNVEDPESA